MNKPTEEIDWVLHYGFPTDDTPPYQLDMHTEGMSAYGLPELGVVLALPQEVVQNFLNIMAMCQKDKLTTFTTDEVRDDLLDGASVRIVPTVLGNTPTSFFILPDNNGKLPTEEGCEYPFNMQLIFLENIKNKYHL